MTLKITLVGNSGTGKTCLLLAIGNSVIAGTRKGGYGYKFLVPRNQGKILPRGNPSDDDVDWLSNHWKTMTEESEWTNATAEAMHEYHFRCTYDGSPFDVRGVSDDFTLVDHRGGLISKNSDDVEKYKYQKLINNSNAVILTLPAHLLIEATHKNNIASLVNYDDTLNYTVQNSHNNFTFIIAITMSDYFTNETKNKYRITPEDTVQFLVDHFGIYLDKCRAAMIVPVAMGSNLGGTFRQGDSFTGELKPLNVHLPILFAFYAATRFQRESFFWGRKKCQDMENELLKEFKDPKGNNLAVMYYKGKKILESVNYTDSELA